MDQVTISHPSPIFIEEVSITFSLFVSLHFQTLLGHILKKKNNKAKLLLDGVQANVLLNFFIVQKLFTQKINLAYSKANVFHFWKEGCSMLKFLYLFSFIQFFVTFLLSDSMSCIHHSEAKFYIECIF